MIIQSPAPPRLAGGTQLYEEQEEHRVGQRLASKTHESHAHDVDTRTALRMVHTGMAINLTASGRSGKPQKMSIRYHRPQAAGAVEQ